MKKSKLMSVFIIAMVVLLSLMGCSGSNTDNQVQNDGATAGESTTEQAPAEAIESENTDTPDTAINTPLVNPDDPYAGLIVEWNGREGRTGGMDAFGGYERIHAWLDPEILTGYYSDNIGAEVLYLGDEGRLEFNVMPPLMTVEHGKVYEFWPGHDFSKIFTQADSGYPLISGALQVFYSSSLDRAVRYDELPKVDDPDGYAKVWTGDQESRIYTP
jgi:hypothetical protein